MTEPLRDNSAFSASVLRLQNRLAFFQRGRQAILDYISTHIVLRWIYFVILFYVFWYRVIAYASHFVIAYMYAVYALNSVIRFLTPLDFQDLCAAHEAAHGGTILPSSEGNRTEITLEKMRHPDTVYEFRPFLRDMNEFTFWLCLVRATYVALFCMLFDALDVPVFWPLLVVYFVGLFALTMREQLENMIKYKYVPFNIGKRTYGSITRQAR
ncbi:Rer1 (ER retrieval) family protein [Babesia bovis T2Bo]|uniref:Protein RER1 n=1 Tax=Babesia bovis TaxID=5865 RepID=A7AMF7_BABBO|nr:Rer1 (ER retrieval) family protein [Babesia bovis T2Bo]EDO07741.1 Rer1 (ER retrieval) family protein [Babesia bovis T2Bo]|eukprot:XP_001611309.1 Rer1 family protein [Babesia bovis T2Bo]